MSKKTYRVICTKEPFKDEIIVDIAPARHFIHEMIFAARKKQNPKLENLAGSVFLTVISEQEPVVSYTTFKAGAKNNGVAKYYENLAKTLTPLIKKTYFKMKENGKDSTLDINIKDYFEFSNSNEKFRENKKTPAENHTKKMPCKPEVLLAWRQAHILGD